MLFNFSVDDTLAFQTGVTQKNSAALCTVQALPLGFIRGHP